MGGGGAVWRCPLKAVAEPYGGGRMEVSNPSTVSKDGF